MAARPRKSGSKDLPPHLYRKGDGFIYRHPKAKKTKSFRDKVEAINYAINANHKIGEYLKNKSFEEMKYSKSIRISLLLKEVKEQYLPRLKHTKKTLQGEHTQLRKFDKDLGALMLAQIDQNKLSSYLDDNYKKNGRTKARGLLIHIYKYALSKGYCEANLALNTLPTVKEEKVKQPHTEEGFNLIKNNAPEWLADMMLFIKATLLRPDDVRNLKKSDVDLKDMTIKVEVRKTRNYKKPIYLKIFLGDLMPEAIEVVKRRMASTILSPYLFCYRPTRVTQKALDAKPHWSYITQNVASKTFQRVRDKVACAYADLTPMERPTLKETRNFGSVCMRDAGYPDAYIQKLMSHKDFATTQIYLDNGKPEYQEVKL